MTKFPLLTSQMSLTFGVAAGLLAVVACGHPSTGSSSGGGGSNGQLGTGGAAIGASTGGNFGTPGSGGSLGTLGGGTGGINVNPNGGTTAGTSTGGTTVTGGGGAAATTAKMSCTPTSFPSTYPYSQGYPGHAANMAMAQTMLQSLSPVQKTSQMRGVPVPASTSIFWQPNQGSIRGFKFRDGPRGVNMDAPLESNSFGGKSTAFPQAIARGATFDLDLEYHIGQAMGDEMVAAGQDMSLAPTVNILRHPSWGRAQETYGEDPFLLGRLGSAFVTGMQEYVAACAKHFAANNIEQSRSTANALMDEQTLREMYARHFGMIIKDGGVSCIMASYNKVNGLNATQNAHLLTDILRTDFGFQGFVLSDWWAMPPGNSGGDQATRATNARQAVMAGLDMELPWAYEYLELDTMTGLDSFINSSATRILEQKFRFNAMSITGNVGLKPSTSRLTNGSITNNDDHIALAAQAALESAVLLKNDGAVLPFSRTAIKSIAVIGASIPYAVSSDGDGDSVIDFTTNLVTGGATTILTGDWGSSRVVGDPAKAVGPLPGIRAAAGTGITVMGGPSPTLAAAADVTVVVAGLTPQDEGEEYTNLANPDRQSFALDAKRGTGTQNNLIMSAVTQAAGKPVIVVLEGSGPIDMPWLSAVKGVIMAWYPGMVGGTALGKLLFGDANFSGKLPLTWSQVSDYGPFKGTGTDTQMDFYLGYRRFDQNNIALDPAMGRYPFGYGLSYGTNYQYSAVRVPCSDIGQTGSVDIQVDVTNAGARPGDETVFLFVAPPATPPTSTGGVIHRAKKELKGFARVTVPAGGKATATIKLRIPDLAYFDPATTGGGWKVQPGVYTIMAGGSSASLPVMDTLTIK